MGYEIYERYRGHHYAVRVCRLLMDYAKRAHMEHVDITCDIDNYPSIRTCELLGAQKLGMIAVPPDNIEFEKGSRLKISLSDNAVNCLQKNRNTLLTF